MITTRTAVEQYVGAMLKTHTIQSLPKKFVQKALALINKKIDSPCCTDPDAEIDLITATPSPFISTIESMLNSIYKQGNKTSLLRTKRLLERRLDCSC